MASTYKQFLAGPTPSILAPDASLYYITSNTSYQGATEVIKHFHSLRNQVKRKKQDFLDVIEGQRTSAFQIDTTLEFITSGGPYVPGLDDNFLSDKTVYLPVMHIVTFDKEGRIAQIRQSWDQGALLKQLDVIGKTGRNWPIRDSKEQIRIITQCLKKEGTITTVPDTSEMTARSRGNSTNALRDPHASLHLIGTREELETPGAGMVSPYAGNRPSQRSLTEILGEQDEEQGDEQSPSRGRSQSPSKSIAHKFGASKNYKPSRLFEAGEEEGEEDHETPTGKTTVSHKFGAGKNYGPSRLFEGSEDVSSGDPNTPVKKDEKFYRPDPKRYQHFDFADGSDPQDRPKPGMPFGETPKSKGSSQWSFDDFVTPQKLAPSRTGGRREERHWDTEGTSGTAADDDGGEAQKPRRDAKMHFDLLDDGPTPTDRPAVTRPRGAMQNTGLHLYDPSVHRDEGGGAAGPDQASASARPLGTITNLKDRHKDFDNHYESTDAGDPADAPAAPQFISDDRMKAVKMMESNWQAYDESPTQKENKPSNGSGGGNGGEGGGRGIKIAGDGMGGPKGTSRDYVYGEDTKPAAVPGKRQGARSAAKPFWE